MRLSDLPPHVQERARAILAGREAPAQPRLAESQILQDGGSGRAGTAYTERRAGRMNRTEARYHEHLEAQRAAGLVRWTEYEGLTFRLPGGVRWTPDFPVLTTDGCLVLHEVKGRKGDTWYATEKARLKLRIASEVLPFPILIAWPARNGAWHVTPHPAR